MPMNLLVDGEYARRPAVLNRPMVEALVQSGYLPDGSDFAGFTQSYPTIPGEVGVVSGGTIYPFGQVERYGAIGDGLDFTAPTNTAAIQTAVNNVNALGSGTVSFASNVNYYKINAAINLGIVGNITLKGNGARLIPITAGQRGVTAGGPISNVVADGLSIIGTGFASGYVFSPGTNIQIKNLRVSGANVDDPTSPGFSGGIIGGTVTDVYIDRCTFDNNGFTTSAPQTLGGDIVFGGNSGLGDVQKNVNITRCTCSSTAVFYNIALFDASYSFVAFNSIKGARVDAGSNQRGGYGVLCYATSLNPQAVHHNKVLFNDIQDTQGTGIYYQSGSYGLIAGNTLSGTCQFQDDSSLVVAAIGVSNGHDNEVVDNIISNFYSGAICINDTYGTSFSFSVHNNTINGQLAGGVQTRPVVYIRGQTSKSDVSFNNISNILQAAIGNRDNGQPIPVTRNMRLIGNSIVGAKVLGTGGIYSVAGATVFELSQTGLLANGDKIVVNNTAYTVSVLAGGGLTCTLSGAPTFGSPGPPINYLGFYTGKLIGPSSRGILVFGAQDYTVTDNDIENVYLEGMLFQDGGSGGSQTTRIRVSGGTISDHSAGGGANFGVLISGSDSSVTLVNVHAGVFGFGSGGIQLAGVGSKAYTNNVNGIITAAYYAVSGGAKQWDNYDNSNISYRRSNTRIDMNAASFSYARQVQIYSAAMSIDASLGNVVSITPTDGAAFTLNAPSSLVPGMILRITIVNTFGVLGAITWNAIFKKAAWTNPANGFSRTIVFLFNGTNLVEERDDIDVPN